MMVEMAFIFVLQEKKSIMHPLHVPPYLWLSKRHGCAIVPTALYVIEFKFEPRSNVVHDLVRDEHSNSRTA